MLMPYTHDVKLLLSFREIAMFPRSIKLMRQDFDSLYILVVVLSMYKSIKSLLD